MAASGKIQNRSANFEYLGKVQLKFLGLTGAPVPKLFPFTKRETQNSCKPAGAMVAKSRPPQKSQPCLCTD